MITRRFFIGGAAAFGAQAVFGAQKLPRGFDPGQLRLRFGVITDLHFACNGRELLKDWNTQTLHETLEWFRAQGVDAVLCGGDIADRSQVEEMRAFAETWFSVFPDDRLPNGNKVERVFVTGNHDSHGHKIYKGLPKIYPDPEELKRHVFADRREALWKELFHEDYRSIYLKTVRGYGFVGSMWEDGASGREGYSNFGRIAPFMEANGRKLDPKLPFFYIQHPHPKDTCYGPWAWGHDGGEVTACLSKYPNAVAFSGHSHYPLTDERSIWQGAFTSVGAASLRYCGNTDDEFAPDGFENGSAVGRNRRALNQAKMMASLPIDHSSRQGLLVSVYDDCIVYAKRDFSNGLLIGDDWVQPLPAAESRPFAFAEHAKKFAAPQFAADAKLSVAEKPLKDRAGNEKPAVELTIPAIAPKRDARVHHFEVTATGADGAKKLKRVLAVGYNQSERSKKAASATTCAFARDELPAGAVSFEAVPVSCFGKKGRPLAAKLV